MQKYSQENVAELGWYRSFLGGEKVVGILQVAVKDESWVQVMGSAAEVTDGE